MSADDDTRTGVYGMMLPDEWKDGDDEMYRLIL